MQTRAMSALGLALALACSTESTLIINQDGGGNGGESSSSGGESTGEAGNSSGGEGAQTGGGGGELGGSDGHGDGGAASGGDVGSGGTGGSGPLTCAEDCAATGDACDTTTGECVDCFNGVGCSVGVCRESDHTCVSCTSNSHCGGASPYCDTENGRCVKCLENAHCAGNPAGEKCFADGGVGQHSFKCGECEYQEKRHCASTWDACEGLQTCSVGQWPLGHSCYQSNGSVCGNIGNNGCSNGTPPGVRCPDGRCYDYSHVCE